VSAHLLQALVAAPGAETSIPELFATRYRYRGTAPAMNVAGVAVPPLIAGTLQAAYGSWAIGFMLAIVAAVSLVCTYLLPETAGTAFRSIRGVDSAFVAPAPARRHPSCTVVPGSAGVEPEIP
jgi:hypothetical protein